jgi:hypothetical protein
MTEIDRRTFIAVTGAAAATLVPPDQQTLGRLVLQRTTRKETK